ncbi:hypothetical protein INT47_012887 [Mucor saturninus]|uniref:Protein kinase domain-containing protein n=1 Tax=Mucor saturninus TaxID=64648 RepID=A0A8H7QPF5_9FUNG|nr:hypothetical protein INT47_012887 [Mucor saturninus]
MSQKATSPVDSLQQQQRPRSNSVIRALTSQHSPTQTPTTQAKQSHFKRSMSVSEGLHVRLPTLYHSETEPISYSPVTQPTTPICPSDSNWANKYDDFDIGNPIGYGSSAVVYEAIYKPLKKRVAIKMIDLDMFERNQIDELRRETALMALSKHPNVLRVYGSFVNGSKLYIVTPYLAAGSCLDIMKSSFPDGFDEISIATILRQALEGLIYLHKNGHIHRDVKAGNLLMDQQGTVLLADFGVSSSLAENGDVRKTFVGTPCWMAPEVMEQAGYDYKADIWSFGITALELATGHAPFAKFPPMKVLMMTLSNAPPTLDRENAKHKFSKYFKDMIDLCLQKEPNKRPSAEKLIIHPFFKQAKKRDYLVKSVLANVLPLDKRPHRKIPHKKIAFQTTEQWDFDDTQTENQPIDTVHTPEKLTVLNTTALNTPEKVTALNTPEKPTALNTPEKPILTATPQDTPFLDRSKSTVQFDECPKPNLVKTSSIHASPIDTIDTPKKHISFGEAVIKDPSSSSSRSIMSPVVESPSPILSEPAGVAVSYPPPTLSSAPLSKKSRFVIQDSAPSSAHPSHISPAAALELHTPPMSATELSHTGVGLGICTSPTNTVITNMNTVPTINNSTPSSAAAAAAVAGGLQEGEFKKGRFSVNQTPTRPATPVEDLPANDMYRTTPMSRATSQDSFQERKSRFEVKQKSNHGQDPATPLQSFPLTRENSNVSTREGTVSNKVSRFSIEKPDGTCSTEVPSTTTATATPTTAATAAATVSTAVSAATPATPATPASTAALSPECRKKGRFELTGGNDSSKEFINMLESPQSTVAPSPVISPCNSISRGQAHRILDPSMPNMVYSHMENLLKQTEIQKNMLHDLLATMPIMYTNPTNASRSRTISDSKKPSSIPPCEDFYQRTPATSSSSSLPSAVLSTDITSTVEHLQQLLLYSSKERERLARENEGLRRELDRLRKSQIKKPSSNDSPVQEPKPLVAPEAQDNNKQPTSQAEKK